jgi:alpha-D-xyloside xylohydrolase
MRAMVMDFNRDDNVRSIGDQYMFGPSFLVAPVYKYQARKREIYFPASCGWYDFYTGRFIDGGYKLQEDAPYERMPLFVKEGSIIPFGPEIQYTDEKPANPITLFIYTGRDCAFTLYEDEGTNYNYENGACSTIKFSFNNETGELTIGERKGEYIGMLKSRTFKIVWISKNNPVPFDLEIIPQATVRYDGKTIIIKRENL